MLDCLGVRMGPKNARPDWIGRHWSNPMGHFENPDMVWLNGKILDYPGTGVHESARWEQVAQRAQTLQPENRPDPPGHRRGPVGLEGPLERADH